jgi:hypothetical protein
MPSRPLAIAVIVLQALLVSIALRADARRMIARAIDVLPGWRLPVLVVAMMGSSAVVGRDIPRYVGEVLTSSLIQLVSLATLVLAVRAIPMNALHRLGDRFEKLIGDDIAYGDNIRPHLDRFALLTAIAVAVVCAVLSVVVYERHPHVPDEVAYLFQARTFATGRITLPNPPVPSAFELYLLKSGPQGWFSPVPPGWAAMLAPGAFIGAAWLVNPALTGLNVLLVYLVLQPLYGRRVARLSTLLFAVSPWNLFLGMSFMSQTFTLSCALLATYAVITARRTDQARWAWLGGVMLGVAAAVRQLDAMVIAGALGLWAIGFGGRRLRYSGTFGLVVGALLGTAPLLAFNQYFTGKMSTFPIMAYNDVVYGKGANAYGFGKDRGMGWALDPNPGHGPVDGMINSALNVAATQVELFGWSVGSLLLVYAFVLRGRVTTADRLMLGLIALTWLAYFFNYFSGGPDFGARYWFLMIVPFVALTARGALTLRSPSPRAPGSESSSAVDTPLLTGIAVMSLAALLVFVPWRSADKYWHFRGMRGDIPAMAATHGFGNALVLIAGRDFPDFASAAAYNSLDLDQSGPVYARRTNVVADSALIAAFGNRPVWFVDGPAVTGNGYAVRAGPMAAAEALRRLSVPVDR